MKYRSIKSLLFKASKFKNDALRCFCTLSCFALLSCENLVEVDIPPSTLDRNNVFTNRTTAEAAARGMYEQMQSTAHTLFYGGPNGAQALTGLCSDELFHPPAVNTIALQFQENNLLTDNSYVESIWKSSYESIYTANVLVEGSEASSELVETLKDQLIGEGLFVRSFCHFYLVNLFGAVPLVISSDYSTNARIPRTSVEEVYSQIVEDLLKARELLSIDYPDNGERIRANRSVATALLARVYLYMGNWEEAENMASELIGNSTYDLVDLNDIMLSNNLEAIWQLPPGGTGINLATTEGLFYNISGNLSNNNALREDLVNVFETDDKRKSEWVRLDGSDLYAPYKYKVSASGGNRSEYSTIFRLAEQYLIRAEARAQQGNITGVQEDLNTIRNRAELENTTAMTQVELLNAILKERQVELFTEWGHRWLDLKRMGKAMSALSELKPGFSIEDELWPIPQQEINNNPAIRDDQNPGY